MPGCRPVPGEDHLLRLGKALLLTSQGLSLVGAVDRERETEIQHMKFGGHKRSVHNSLCPSLSRLMLKMPSFIKIQLLSFIYL